MAADRRIHDRRKPENEVEVQVCQGHVARAPAVIRSLGLGSCVAVTLYDRRLRIGGLAHIMLPSAMAENLSPYQGADTGIARLLGQLLNQGSEREFLVSKMAGGASMFASYSHQGTGIGWQNVESIKSLLARESIPIESMDVGGHHGRNVEFRLDSGALIVSALKREDIIL